MSFLNYDANCLYVNAIAKNVMNSSKVGKLFGEGYQTIPAHPQYLLKVHIKQATILATRLRRLIM